MRASRADIERLYEELGPALLAYARSLLRSRAEAEDVLQQVFLKLMTYSLPREPRPYLFRAVRNTCSNMRRGEAREKARCETPMFTTAAGPDDLAVELEQALRELPDEEPWDEDLASIVERNGDALATMHRGSRLAHCDWGLEHERLAEAPIAHVARGRALLRLNVLHGKRHLHQGQAARALEAWLAGVRFSRHIASDGPWLSALVAARGLTTHFDALADAVRQGRFDAEARRTVHEATAGLPADGFDWSVAARREAETLSALLTALERSDAPLPMLTRYFPGQAAAGLLRLSPLQLSSPDDVRAALRHAREAHDRLRPMAVSVFEEPYEIALHSAPGADRRAAQNPVLAQAWPSLVRLNASRGSVVRARAELMSLLGRRP